MKEAPGEEANVNPEAAMRRLKNLARRLLDVSPEPLREEQRLYEDEKRAKTKNKA
jgi:hypothetical protein